jgi:Tat protein secretion system quality control protein TatD with DNase activity
VLSKRERKKREKEGKDEEENVEDGKDNEKEDEKPKSAPYPPRICLHSYSGTASHLSNTYLHPSTPSEVFVSFSTAINLGNALDGETPESFAEVVKAVPDHMLLVESDLHIAGEEMDRRLEDIVRRIYGIKRWGLEDGVGKLAGNWEAFVFGGTRGKEEVDS